MKITDRGKIKEVTVDAHDVRDCSVIPHFEVFYKGKKINKVYAFSFHLFPVEQDPGNQELLDDLGIVYENH